MSICPSFTHSEGRTRDALEATKHLHENDGEGTSENPNDAKLKRAAERRFPPYPMLRNLQDISECSPEHSSMLYLPTYLPTYPPTYLVR